MIPAKQLQFGQRFKLNGRPGVCIGFEWRGERRLALVWWTDRKGGMRLL